jgi:hypothetical protein
VIADGDRHSIETKIAITLGVGGRHCSTVHAQWEHAVVHGQQKRQARKQASAALVSGPRAQVGLLATRRDRRPLQIAHHAVAEFLQ